MKLFFLLLLLPSSVFAKVNMTHALVAGAVTGVAAGVVANSITSHPSNCPPCTLCQGNPIVYDSYIDVELKDGKTCGNWGPESFWSASKCYQWITTREYLNSKLGKNKYVILKTDNLVNRRNTIRYYYNIAK